MTLKTMSIAALVALCLIPGPAAARQPAAPATFQLELPAPSGRYPVGVTELHLTDEGRQDPWAPPKPRELMVSIWYPAAATSAAPAAPYMPPNAARVFAQGLLKPIGLDPLRLDLSALRTHSGRGMPAARRRGGFPVVLYSPGGNQPRAMGTTLVEDLASRGYVVVAIDHTHEAAAVEFPGGRVETNLVPRADDVLERMQAARLADVRFVLERLHAVARGAGRRSRDVLPDRLPQAFDLARLGMFGHSAGGFTALQALADDDRIDAAANLDGSLAFSMSRERYGVVVEKGLSKPFLLMGGGVSGRERKPHTHAWAPDWKRLWERSGGWKRDMYLADAEHMSFTDQQVLLPQVTAQARLSPLVLAGAIGRLEPSRSLAAQRDLLAAFFDQHLKGSSPRLLELALGNNPAVTIIP